MLLSADASFYNEGLVSYRLDFELYGDVFRRRAANLSGRVFTWEQFSSGSGVPAATT